MWASIQSKAIRETHWRAVAALGFPPTFVITTRLRCDRRSQTNESHTRVRAMRCTLHASHHTHLDQRLGKRSAEAGDEDDDEPRLWNVGVAAL